MSRADKGIPIIFRIISDSKRDKFIVEHKFVVSLDGWYEEKDKDNKTIIFPTLDAAREYMQERKKEEEEIWEVVE